MAEDPTRKLAVLIDAENTSPKVSDGLFEEIAKIGEASVRSSPSMSKPRRVLSL